MRDFRAYVRTQLAPCALPAAEERKVVDELAAQLEERYEALLEIGRSDEQAWHDARSEIPDWAELRADLATSAPLVHRLADPSMGRLRGRAKTESSHGCASLRKRRPPGSRLGLRRAQRSRLHADRAPHAHRLPRRERRNLHGGHAVLLRLWRESPDAERIVAFADQFPTVDPNFSLLNNARSYFDRPQAVPAVEDQRMSATTRRAINVEGKPSRPRGSRSRRRSLRSYARPGPRPRIHRSRQ